MDPFSLRFLPGDTGSRYKIKGRGIDLVGGYKLKGTHNHENGRMTVDKKYIAGTGNPTENLGHTVKLRLAWDRETQEFIGTYHVSTSRWTGSGEWVIKAVPLTEDVAPSEYTITDTGS